MVSYAAPGGGVGPHFDSYDVFLLQGFGRRRWRYGPQDDLELKPGLPVKILRRFAPAHDDVLVPGDMLYLPPHFAHDGVAVDTCTTYSIGFRAPSTNELAGAFLDFLRDEVDLDGRYADPDLAPTREPARIGAAMLARCARELGASRVDPVDGGALSRLLAVGAEADGVLRPAAASAAAAPRSPARSRATALASTGARSSSTTTGSCSSTAARTPGRTTTPASRHCGGSQTNGGSRPPRPRRCPPAAWPSSTSGTAMATSTPPPADGASALPPEPVHERLDTLAAQVAAIDRLVELARLSIRVFDGDLAQTGWDSVARTEGLARFLRGSRHARLEIIVHDTRWIEASAPRLRDLLRQFSHAMTIYRTGAGARAIADPLVIVDGRHYLHRLHLDHPRAVLGVDAPQDARPLVTRFEEIWATGEPGLTGTTLGL